jgi:4-hydroxy-2-oxoheptanedioate aldolase
MRPNGLQTVWETKNYALNAWLSIGSSYSAEIFANLPYNAVTVDLQHGMFDLDTALSMLQAISTTSAVPMVRVPHNATWLIQKVLDMGAYGVICPMIDTRADCEAFVRSMRYPPHGERSFGPSRGLLYGGADYVLKADSTVLSWAMIETQTALGNLDAIASVEGLDGIYIGPSDLSMTLEGTITNPLSPRVVREIERIVETARSNGLRVGIFCPDVPFARDMVDLGCDLITVMNDAGLVRKATNALLEELKTAMAERVVNGGVSAEIAVMARLQGGLK